MWRTSYYPFSILYIWYDRLFSSGMRKEEEEEEAGAKAGFGGREAKKGLSSSRDSEANTPNSETVSQPPLKTVNCIHY